MVQLVSQDVETNHGFPFKRSGWYYLQFYSTKRSPKKKQVALKTKSKRTAEKLQARRV